MDVIAGLTIGALGLIGPTHHLYRRCSLLVTGIRHHSKELKSCKEQLGVQKGLHRGLWIGVLSLLNIDNDLALVMIDDENHPQWKDENFLKQGNEILGEHFTTGVKAIERTLTSIEEILSKVARQEEIKQDSTESHKNRRRTRLRWSLEWREKLEQLLNTLRKQNQDLTAIYAHQQALQYTSNEPLPQNQEDMIPARLSALIEVSKLLCDSIAEMSFCDCHCVHFKLDSEIGRIAEVTQDPMLAPPIQGHIFSRQAIIRKFPLVITKIDERDNLIIQPISEYSGTGIVISSEPEERGIAMSPLKRLILVGPQGEESLRKHIRFADNQVVETSSTWAIVTTISKSVGSKAGELQFLDLQDKPDTKPPKAPPRSGSEHMKRKAKAKKSERKRKGKAKESEVIDTKSMLAVGSDFETTSGTQRSSSPTPMTEIDNFCSIMENPFLGNEAAIGYCLGQIKSGNPERHHFVYCDQQTSISHLTRVSLEDILYESYLVRRESLIISLVLAECVLEFGSFPNSFFPLGWRSRNIFFFHNLNDPFSFDSLPIPYITPTFTSSNPNIPTSPARSDQLFSLAITLLEIGLGNPLWKTRVQGSYQPSNIEGPIGDYMDAKTLLEQGGLEKTMGLVFLQIVGRCLYCDFGIDEHDLSKKTLQDAFYKKVVVPLRNCLESTIV